MRSHLCVLVLASFLVAFAGLCPAQVDQPPTHSSQATDLASLPPELRPLDVVRPVLPEDTAAEVAELEARIAELEPLGLRAQTREEQDPAWDEANGLAERVLAIRLEHQGNLPAHEGRNAIVRWRDARGEPVEWHEVSAARRTLADLRLLRGLDDSARTALASLNGTDAEVERLYAEGKYAEAQAMTQRQLDIRRRVLGDQHLSTLASIGNMGVMLESQGRLAEAEPYSREALEGRRRVLGDEHPDTLGSINNMGSLLMYQGRLAEAEAYLREALEGRRRVLGDGHPDTLASIGNMGVMLDSQGRLAEAEPYYREALEASRRVLRDEHPGTLTSINNLGALLELQGHLAEAEPYYREALEGRRRVLGDGHPQTLGSIGNMGVLLNAQGRLAEAEPYYREALSTAEGLRLDVIGDASARAQFAGELNLPAIAAGSARVLLGLDQAAEALGVLERGRGRAGLDLFAGGRSAAGEALRATADADRLARYDAALAAEQVAQVAVYEAEARLSKAPDEDKAARRDEMLASRQTLSEKTAAVFAELRGLVPTLDPLSADEMLAALAPGEALLTWSWTEEGVLALVARDGVVTGVTLAGSKEGAEALSQSLAALRSAIASRPVGGDTLDGAVLAAARHTAAPEELRALLEGASSVLAITDGPVAGIPVELLLDRPVAYAPSATIALRPRMDATLARAFASTGGVIVGDPVFAGNESRPEPDYPETGVLMAMVVDGGNGAQAGLQRGDVLLSYNGAPLDSVADLKPAVDAASEQFATRAADAGERPVPATVWRATEDSAGETVEVRLAPGKLGVQLSQAPPAEGLRSMAVLSRSSDTLAAEAAQLEQVRFYGAALSPLPATRLEASAVAAMLGDGSILLLGQDATAPRVRQAVASASPRIIHLATHGLLGNSRDPLLASVALTSPKEPTRDDTGFLTLEDILATWGGQLRGVELVTLSACDTGRGFQQGDTVMGLPLGLLVGGADSVMVSLWKVDDKATALLMARFYANWLGKTQSERESDGVTYSPGQTMPKLAALREAQQ